MTQRIMLRARKYLHAVLIGPRARSSRKSSRRVIAILSLWKSRQNREISVSLLYGGSPANFAVTEVRAGLHGKVLRECFKCKRKYMKKRT